MTQPSGMPKHFRYGNRNSRVSAVLVLALLLNLVIIQFASAAGADNLANAYASDISGSLPLVDDVTDATSATSEGGEIGTCGNFSAAGNGHSVWYRYLASTGWLTLNTLNSNYDTVLEVFAGPEVPTYGTLTSVTSAGYPGCNDDAASSIRQSELTIPVIGGTYYYIVVRTYGVDAIGTLNLNFSASFSAQKQVYVNQTTGNDGNTGSFALPFRTIGKAESVLPASGGVIQVLDSSSYNEAVTIDVPTTFQVSSGPVSVASLTLTANPVTAPGTFTVDTVTVQSGAKIQEGIDLAVSGGTVKVVASSTYTESLSIGDDLSLISTTGATLYSTGTTIAVSAGVVTITGLNISGATAALSNTGGTVTASSNWWGSATGPTASTNPSGTGSAISGTDKYRPWCTVPAPTCNATGGVATQLAFTTQPSDSTPNAPFPTQPIVTAKDAAGNIDTSYNGSVTLAIKGFTGTGGAALNGTATVLAVNGRATFSGLSIDLIGAGYQLTADDSTLPIAESAAFNITAGTPTQLVFNPSPSNSTGGVAFPTQPVVEVQDAGGYVVTNYTGSITMTIANNPGGGTLAGTTTVQVSNGKATFSNLSIDKPGAGYTLQASSGALTGTSAAFNITVGSVSKLVFKPSPSNAQAGSAFPTQPIVEAQDAGGNLVPSFNVTVTLTIASNPGGGTLSGTTTVTAIAGVATFTGLSIDKAGAGYTLQASAGALSGTSAAFNIAAGAPTKLIFTNSPADTRVGVAFTNQPVVEAHDAFDNIAIGFTGPVTLTITNGTGALGATLGGTATVNAVNGVASFSGLSIDKIATGYQLTASIAGPITVDSTAFNITATGLVFTLQPVTTPAGQPLMVTVAAQDATNNTDTTFNGAVTLAIKFGTGSSRGTLAGTVTVNAVNGVADFTGQGLNIIRAGTDYILIASATGLAGAESQPFDITNGAVTQLSFTTSPSNTPADAPLTLVIEARDVFDNLATTYTGTLDLAIGTNPGGGTLGGTISKVFSGGLVSFGVAEGTNINKIGVGYTLHAMSGAFMIQSAAFNITASRLVFAAAPGTTPVGSAFAQQPVLRAEDSFGTLDTTFTGPVTLAILSGTGTSGAALNGTATLAATGGIATFSRLAIDRVGTGYQLSATAAGLPSVTSNSFDITKAMLYVPIMLTPGYADLVARFSLSTSVLQDHAPVLVTVTITNQGNAPADPFWVDFYINPTLPPIAANQPWDKSCDGRRCEQGIAWYVEKVLAPGESITLTSTPGSYYGKNTVWDGSFNTGLLNLYVYADSWNPGVPTGAAYESNETNNRAEFHTLPAHASAAARTAAPPPADLPALPARPARPEPVR
jgi:hypothetical protein